MEKIKKPSHATVLLKRAYSHALARNKIWKVSMVSGTVKKTGVGLIGWQKQRDIRQADPQVKTKDTGIKYTISQFERRSLLIFVVFLGLHRKKETSIRYEDTTRGRKPINCKEDMLNFTSRVTKKQMEKVAGE